MSAQFNMDEDAKTACDVLVNTSLNSRVSRFWNEDNSCVVIVVRGKETCDDARYWCDGAARSVRPFGHSIIKAFLTGIGVSVLAYFVTRFIP